MEKVPIFINSFNRLTWLQNTVRELTRFEGCGDIIIVDNDSTYPPLLNWFKWDIPHEVNGCKVRLMHSGRNAGPRGAFHAAVLNPGADYYLVCDPDLDLSRCPQDLLLVLRQGLIDNPGIIKTGPSIQIDDIPDEYPWKHKALRSEGQYWENKHSDVVYVTDPTNPCYGLLVRWFHSEIDTHFTMLRKDWGFAYGPALRSAPPYMVRHLPWYTTPANVTEEDRYYLSQIPDTHMGGLSYSSDMRDGKALLGIT